MLRLMQAVTADSLLPLEIVGLASLFIGLVAWTVRSFMQRIERRVEGLAGRLQDQSTAVTTATVTLQHLVRDVDRLMQRIDDRDRRLPHTAHPLDGGLEEDGR